MAKLESKFQADLIKELKREFPGCVVLKNDSQYLQGVPDLLLLWEDRWAMIECKASIFEPYRPNQEYYLDKFDEMSYATMICPENKEHMIYEIQQTFGLRR